MFTVYVTGASHGQYKPSGAKCLGCLCTSMAEPRVGMGTFTTCGFYFSVSNMGMGIKPQNTVTRPLSIMARGDLVFKPKR